MKWENATLTSLGSVMAGPDWFAIKTRSRYEKKVAEQLDGKGVEVFRPLRKENRGWCDRQKLVTISPFPGYAFVRFNEKTGEYPVLFYLQCSVCQASSGRRSTLWLVRFS